jgi:hypothetical protein
MAQKNKQSVKRGWMINRRKFSHTQLLIFSAVFALAGGYFLYKSLAATTYYLSPTGNDSNPCSQAAPCLSFDRAYQVASPGSKVQIASGTYGSQQINPKASMRNLSPGCTLADTTNCVTFEPVGTITINGKLEVRGSSVYIKGSRSTSTPDANATFTINTNGYADVESESDATYPDHIIMQGINTNTFGAFNVNTATFKDMDVGPATTYWAGTYQNCCREGVGFENKIGWGGDNSFVPKDITIDSVRIHNQNGDSTRLQPGADVHFGGLFLVTVDGLTVKNSVFERNVVYHVQIQNFGGAPPAKRVVFDSNSFGCAVEWSYEGDVCDGQSSIQFDYDPGTEFRISNNVAANGSGQIYACYVGACGGLTGVNSFNNTSYAQSTTAPPLSGSSTTPTVSISANPASITSGGSSTLSWNSTNTTSCTASGVWTGTKATSGSQSVSPTATSTYNLSCTGIGGTANASATVTVTASGGDTTPPTVSITNPADGSRPAGTINLTANASDNVGVVGVQFKLNGSNLGPEDATAPYSYSWDTTTVPHGSYSLSATARDAAGNIQTVTINVIVDNGTTKPGDLNSDGSVNISDLSILLSNWNTASATADINQDGTVNILDLSILLSNYGG